MPTKRLEQIKAWSYSRLTTYESCPFKAYLKFIKRIKEPTAAPLEHGIDVHDKAEKYTIGLLKKLPKELELFEDEFKALRKVRRKVAVEQQLAVDKSWRLCDWFADDVWCRAKIDLMYEQSNTLYIVDHKTGKVREDTDQLDLYAALGFIHASDHIEKIDARYWYLDWGNDEIYKEYTREDELKLRKLWEKRSKPMLADITFKPKPNQFCKWCYFGKDGKAKGGPGLCKF